MKLKNLFEDYKDFQEDPVKSQITADLAAKAKELAPGVTTEPNKTAGGNKNNDRGRTAFAYAQYLKSKNPNVNKLADMSKQAKAGADKSSLDSIIASKFDRAYEDIMQTVIHNPNPTDTAIDSTIQKARTRYNLSDRDFDNLEAQLNNNPEFKDWRRARNK